MTLPFPEGKLTQRVLPWLAAVLSVYQNVGQYSLYIKTLGDLSCTPYLLGGGQNELLRASYIDTTHPHYLNIP